MTEIKKYSVYVGVTCKKFQNIYHIFQLMLEYGQNSYRALKYKSHMRLDMEHWWC